MTRHKITALGWIALLLVTGCGKVPGIKIAFVSERDGNQEVYVVDPDGSNLANLTRNPAPDYDPVWSPDGKKIAFVSRRGGGGDQVCVMDADGSSQTCLTDPSPRANNRSPVWSPGGKKLAFASSRDGGWEIYVMDADGSNQTNLTNSPAYDSSPVWSPDGSRIAFTSTPDTAPAAPTEGYGVSHTELYVMDADGSDRTKLTDVPSIEGRPNMTPVVRRPRWSPDGKRILFLSNSSGTENLYLIDADGSNLTQITDRYDPPVDPAWSPDGSRVVFAAFERWNAYPERQPNTEIFAVDVDSLEVANVTNSEALDEGMPSWSPDGERIVFAAKPNDRLPPADSRTDYDIYAMDADGSDVMRLTDDPARDSDPVWSP